MKITAIETIQLRGPDFPEIIHPAWTPGGTWARFSSSLIKVGTDEGIIHPGPRADLPAFRSHRQPPCDSGGGK